MGYLDPSKATTFTTFALLLRDGRIPGSFYNFYNFYTSMDAMHFYLMEGWKDTWILLLLASLLHVARHADLIKMELITQLDFFSFWYSISTDKYKGQSQAWCPDEAKILI